MPRLLSACVCQKKLLDHRLSGSVAHVSTEGVEHWLNICGSPEHTLTNKDLQFSVRERILADGQIELPLQTEEIEAIAAKVQLMDCKKVCLNFLHSATNPVHLELAKKNLPGKRPGGFCPGKI
ncbi:hydantoinase/oxoprolinase N-terminal domain-containing protein [Bdellovibrio bacteriovorus]|uniref:hydantoinase/oxoprolinase N-terminal domain-containing protein n=1 Tax=Bdellovibrio bacteriovorus TaxID=959 RepID=UPI0035A7408E